MEKFVIEGGVPLSGTIVPAGNKNAALPLLACSLLTSEEIVLHNVPVIRDVEAMLALLADLGVRVEQRGENTVSLCGDGAGKTAADAALAEPIRAPRWTPTSPSASPRRSSSPGRCWPALAAR